MARAAGPLAPSPPGRSGEIDDFNLAGWILLRPPVGAVCQVPGMPRESTEPRHYGSEHYIRMGLEVSPNPMPETLEIDPKPFLSSKLQSRDEV